MGLSREELEAECRSVAKGMKALVPTGLGFFLVLWDYADAPGDGWWTYMSNGDREDMAKFLRECSDKLRTEHQ